MNTLKELIFQKNWEKIIAKYSPEEICRLSNFSDAMHLTEHLFFDDFQNDAHQQFALKLAFEVKNYFKNEWENDWKNYVFLGSLCSLLWLYDEQYIFYKKAYDMLKDPPPALLLLLAGCSSAPGTPPISEEESEIYLKRAIEKKITYESALMMRTVCERKGDKSQAEYWDYMYKKLEKENISSDLLVPDVLKE